MILIADSGSSKVDWAFVSSTWEKRMRTCGINPAYLTDDKILEILYDSFSFARDYDVNNIFFFGAGVVGSQMQTRLESCFKKLWPSAECRFYSDVLASALALFGEGCGIACILGTGSNSCLCEGGQIVRNVRAGGFILGDEGSGAWIGKRLLQDYIKEIMPEPVRDDFEREYSLSYSQIVDRVYRQERPAAYMAQLSLFAAARMEDGYIHELVADGFDEFLCRNVLRYEECFSVPVGFVGSVAMQYREILESCMQKRNLTLGSVLKAPIDNLVRYYKSKCSGLAGIE